ncbi:hypothetical protein [Cytobacillus praedii]|uniref:hypothetical protein n=1 Tax=Cytobacillus praedii TaxID=1742358 RepID=UPI002E2339A6|nr:hypothetical protein [Cytobacillus praedii]
MVKTIEKKAIIYILFLFVLGISFLINLGTTKVFASTIASINNSEIEELKVEYYKNQYKIHVGDRTGTLLIKYERPKTERDVEWLNWSLRGTSATNMGLELDYDPTMGSPIIPFHHYESFDYDSKGTPNKWGKEAGILWEGAQKFSGNEYPNYYIGAAVYLPKKFNEEGIYFFINNYYAMKEDGQVRAYFYENRYVIKEAIDGVKTGGIFPLMNKVYWGKTELKSGQSGKATIIKNTTLWTRNSDGSLIYSRMLKPKEQFRVYSYSDQQGGVYGVGGGLFIKKDSNTVKYETPSKANLRLLKIMRGDSTL